MAIHPVPPGKHSRNSIESKHHVIQSISIRLKEASGDRHDARLATYKAVSISNDLYGNDTLSSFEFSKRISKPISAKPIDNEIPEAVITAHEK